MTAAVQPIERPQAKRLAIQNTMRLRTEISGDDSLHAHSIELDQHAVKIIVARAGAGACFGIDKPRSREDFSRQRRLFSTLEFFLRNTKGTAEEQLHHHIELTSGS